jgi:hypothetical protein
MEICHEFIKIDYGRSYVEAVMDFRSQSTYFMPEK